MGTKDLPAMIDYILQHTNQSALHYVGHSMGTTIGYVMASTMPKYNEKMKSFVNLSPVVYLSKMVDIVGPDGMFEDIASKFVVSIFHRVKYSNNKK